MAAISQLTISLVLRAGPGGARARHFYFYTGFNLSPSHCMAIRRRAETKHNTSHYSNNSSVDDASK